MPQLVEDAIKLAILHHPAIFGLEAAEVNPMLMFLQQRMQDDTEQGEVEQWLGCFDAVSTTLHLKVVEVFSGLSLMQRPTQDKAVAAQQNGKPKPESTTDSEKPLSKAARPKANPGDQGSADRDRTLSNNQLRYLGYLIRQTGEQPDYTVISKLSQKEATVRIKDLETKVKGR